MDNQYGLNDSELNQVNSGVEAEIAAPLIERGGKNYAKDILGSGIQTIEEAEQQGEAALSNVDELLDHCKRLR